MLRLSVTTITEVEAYQLLYEALESRKLALVAKIQALNWELRRDGAGNRGRPRKTAETGLKLPQKRNFSEKGRKAIALAQKKRWKAWKTRQKPKSAS